MTAGGPITFGSYCAGIEALSVASHGLGWRASYLCEIADHPRAVLKHRQGAEDARRTRAGSGPMLWGDFTALRVRHLRRLGVKIPDVVGGGTPCQAFSSAGNRLSLGDARGNLTLAFVRQVHAIDNLRAARGEPGLVVLWENVPGVLNTPDNAFGCFLGGLVGSDAPLEGLANARPDEPEQFGKWPDAGMASGPRARVAWRLLDAKHFKLPQRRRRVFVVVSFRDRLDPAAVLFERRLMCGDPGEGGREGPDVAAAVGVDAEGCGEDLSGGIYLGNAEGGVPDLPYLTASNIGRQGNNQQPLIAYPINPNALRGDSEARTPSPDAAGVMRLRDPGLGVGADGDPADTLQASGPGAVAVAFALRGRECGAMPEISGDIVGTLRAANGGSSRDYVAFQSATEFLPQSSRVYSEGEVAPTLQASGKRGGNRAPQIATASAVRRLTPRECERLQGFPDDYTLVPWRGGGLMPDGPRYKALGNSWAVPVARWICTRIDAQLRAEAVAA